MDKYLAHIVVVLMKKNKTKQSICWKLCEGCDCYDGDYYDSDEGVANRCISGIRPSLNDLSCPCINCLIKGCCTNICENYENYSKKFS
jgi:hypothetical protein